MTADEYRAHPATRSTTLKLARESMAKFKAEKDGLIPKTENAVFDLGKACHSAILEQDFKNYVCGPDVSKATKEWKEFVSSHKGLICLQPHNYLVVKGMYEAFFNHPLAPKITNKGMAECSFFANIRGHEYKARPDYLVEDGSGLYIVDYKTCESAEFEAIQRAIGNYGYDISMAHYSRVVEAVVDEKKVNERYWIFQEKEFPHEIAVKRMDDECRKRAFRIVDKLYLKVENCMKSGVWPSAYAPEIEDIDLNRWQAEKVDRYE